ncbi:hypothetical protein [Herbidospora sp. NBRC 101105]|uniref:pentapeptide repeat-containing protein n=1 Tax=Herbidospora sp. NBRC 101105 TaxID=3032195 RepID=UPI0024A57405|nr:hypothetical protein [Herbidospora sp. NBRC 101105]GLX99127.1 hypothetical protein Hesp01_70770 [Herbidospora sp. NBRC 101105]
MRHPRVILGVDLDGGDFGGQKLTDLVIGEGSRLTRCDFTRAVLRGGSLGAGVLPTEYLECDFSGARLKRVSPGRASFISCVFNGVQITDMMSLEAEFIDCTFTGLLKSVTFSATPDLLDDRLLRTRNRFTGNDFSGAELREVGFRGGVDLDAQHLPGGDGFLLLRQAAGILTEAMKDIATWTSKPDRDEASIVTGVLLDETAAGQRDLFIATSFLTKRLSPDYAQRLLSIITA